ncbi:MAG: hypothetical protein CVU51_04235 [Deltaproteobacteria bacterium HGW-Deltaproteobacteria-1]|jgi:Tol biopolymer transport system component|nr:MAG: hypothetical protein CVU51_04235 [Deltaproteobacteria bacterium HGW-Deltaproteobacteria-1]
MLEDKDAIQELSFSHDGKKVVFDRCRNEGCQIQVYDLETGELAAYQSSKNERWTMGKYSDDGKKIAFSVIPVKPKGGLDLGNMQIAVMDADGKNYKKVTTGPGAKTSPTFSHNGKKILYAKAAYIREKGRTPAAQYDAWEINLETGAETQLTFCKYFYMGYLSYFPDDEHFIYWGDMPDEYEGVRMMDQSNFKNKMIELGKKGMNVIGVVVMKGREMIPRPYHFPPNTFAQSPLLSRDGSKMIYEKSQSGEFYLYSEDGNHRYVSGGGSINSAAVSPNGKLLALISVSLKINTYTILDGKLQQSLYLPCAPKKITNWSIPPKYKNIYKMIPEEASRIIN